MRNASHPVYFFISRYQKPNQKLQPEAQLVVDASNSDIQSRRKRMRDNGEGREAGSDADAECEKSTVQLFAPTISSPIAYHCTVD